MKFWCYNEKLEKYVMTKQAVIKTISFHAVLMTAQENTKNIVVTILMY